MEDLRELFRDAKSGGNGGLRPMAICQGPQTETDVSYFLYLSHHPARDRGYFELRRMRKDVGRSRRTMHDTLFSQNTVGDFEQLYAKFMREPAPTPQATPEPPEPAPEPVTIRAATMATPTAPVIREPVTHAAPVMPLPPDVAALQRQLADRDRRILELERDLKAAQGMAAFYRDHQRG
jgi:hypothetical protein